MGVYAHSTRIESTPERETIIEKVPIALDYIAMFTRPVLVNDDPLMRKCFRPRRFVVRTTTKFVHTSSSHGEYLFTKG